MENELIREIVIIGSSMIPTFKDRQKVIIMKNNCEFEEVFTRNTIIIAKGIRFNVDHVVKRIIGLPGETVEIKNNKIYINESELNEYYINEPMKNNEDNKWELSQDEYFVCGDNRNYSIDSRKHGPIKDNEIIAKVICGC